MVKGNGRKTVEIDCGNNIFELARDFWDYSRSGGTARAYH